MDTSAVTVSQQIVRLSFAQVSKYELSLGHHDIAITPSVQHENMQKFEDDKFSLQKEDMQETEIGGKMETENMIILLPLVCPTNSLTGDIIFRMSQSCLQSKHNLVCKNRKLPSKKFKNYKSQYP